jgi:hypothetical protein
MHPTAAGNLQTKNHAFQPVFMAPVLAILYPNVAFSFFVIVPIKRSTNTLANIPRRYRHTPWLPEYLKHNLLSRPCSLMFCFLFATPVQLSPILMFRFFYSPPPLPLQPLL